MILFLNVLKFINAASRELFSFRFVKVEIMQLSALHITSLPEYLYIHYPVCRHVCSYCDFNVYGASRLNLLVGGAADTFNDRWINRILSHLEKITKNAPKKNLKTLYLGGGTPSLLSLKELGRLFEGIEKYFIFSENPELTIECNPENISEEYLRGLRRLRVNRLSLGVQTFHPQQLKRLERLSTFEKIEEALNIIPSFFSNYSVDLMIGIPEETDETLGEDIRRIVRLRPPHVSVYMLTLSDDHKFKKHSSMKGRIAEDGAVAEMYRFVCESLRDAGYEHYEISNFALPEYRSRHNSNYWDVNSEYLALGPGGHGYLKSDGQKIRYENIRELSPWLQSEWGDASVEVLDASQRKLEEFYLRLRTGREVPIDWVDASYADLFVKEGHMKHEGNGVRMTESGWLFMEHIAERLLV